MKSFLPSNLSAILSGRYVFLDNDFLSLLSRNRDFMEQLVHEAGSGYFMIDPLVAFEFLRDSYVPEDRAVKEEFLASEMFNQVPNRQEVYIKLYENALLLSRLYMHQKYAGKASIVDLLLAGRIMSSSASSILITGNRKDYPPCVFDLLTVISVETKEGTVRSFAVLRFNEGSFAQCLGQLQALEG